MTERPGEYDREPHRPRDDPRPDGSAASPQPPDAAASARAGASPVRLVEPARSAPARRPRWAVWATLAILVLGASAGWWRWAGPGRTPADGAGRAGNAPPPAAGRQAGAGIPVEVASARTADVPVYLDSLGTVQAFNSVTVRSRVDGELVEIAFLEGQTVREGDVLARIDPRPYQAALDQAVARKAQSEATRSGTRLDLERTQRLASQEFASRQQLDQQTANVASQTAQIQSDEAAISNARTQLDYATIRAPISGRLGLRLVDRGNIVRAGDQTGIVEIAQLQPISVLFTAPEGQLARIAAAKRDGDVKVWALGPDGRAVLGEGVLALINNTVDPASGTVRLKATFPNDDDRLWPGLSVNTRLLARTLKGALVVPDTALLRGERELFVYVAGPEDKAEKRTVRAGVFSDGLVVIEDGLRDGERVVVAGQSRLQAGARLEIGADPARDGAGPPRQGGRAADAGAVGTGGGGARTAP